MRAYQLLPAAALAATLIFSGCGLNARQLSGIYAGNLANASDVTVETWLQLYSDGRFHQRETAYAQPLSTRYREGIWTLTGDQIVLIVNGEKDIRFTWEHGYLRNTAASAAHPELPLDMVALQRLGQ
jgi:hypothetical protein